MKTFSIPGDNGLSILGYLTECQICKRKIIVEVGLFGVSHNGFLQATCAECLIISDEFKTKYPEIAQEIESFKKNNEIPTTPL